MRKSAYSLSFFVVALEGCSSAVRYEGDTHSAFETAEFRVLTTDAYRVGNDVCLDRVVVQSIGDAHIDRIEFVVFADANANGVPEEVERVFSSTGRPVAPSTIELRHLSFAAVPRLMVCMSVFTSWGSVGSHSWLLTPNAPASPG